MPPFVGDTLWMFIRGGYSEGMFAESATDKMMTSKLVQLFSTRSTLWVLILLVAHRIVQYYLLGQSGILGSTTASSAAPSQLLGLETQARQHSTHYRNDDLPDTAHYPSATLSFHSPKQIKFAVHRNGVST